MRNLIACLLLLIAGPLLAANPSAFKVAFSNGSSVTASSSADGSYRWTSPNLASIVVVAVKPAGGARPARISVSWYSGFSETSGEAQGDGTAVVMVKIMDTVSKAFDTVTVTPIP